MMWGFIDFPFFAVISLLFLNLYVMKCKLDLFDFIYLVLLSLVT